MSKDLTALDLVGIGAAVEDAEARTRNARLHVAAIDAHVGRARPWDPRRELGDRLVHELELRGLRIVRETP